MIKDNLSNNLNSPPVKRQGCKFNQSSRDNLKSELKPALTNIPIVIKVKNQSENYSSVNLGFHFITLTNHSSVQNPSDELGRKFYYVISPERNTNHPILMSLFVFYDLCILLLFFQNMLSPFQKHWKEREPKTQFRLDCTKIDQNLIKASKRNTTNWCCKFRINQCMIPISTYRTHLSTQSTFINSSPPLKQH